MKKRTWLIAAAVVVIGIIAAIVVVCLNNNKNAANIVADGTNEYTTNTKRLAKCDGGYYFCSYKTQYQLLMFFDEQKKEAVPVCGKADCTHDNDQCNAYFPKGQYLFETIYYYRDNIYMFKLDEGMAVLTKVSPDGATREEIAKVMPNNNVTTLNVLFNGDYAYIYDSNGGILQKEEHTESIIEVSLDGKSNKSVYEVTGNKMAIINGKVNGSKLYFLIMQYEKPEGQAYSIKMKGLYAYDFNSQKTDMVYEGDISTFFIDNESNELYLIKRGEGLYKINMTSREESLVYAANDKFVSGAVSYDGKYIYICNNGAGSVEDVTKRIPLLCIVIDKDGNEIDNISYEDTMAFVDQNYMFDLGVTDKKYMLKSEIGNNPEWKVITQ